MEQTYQDGNEFYDAQTNALVYQSAFCTGDYDSQGAAEARLDFFTNCEGYELVAM